MTIAVALDSALVEAARNDGLEAHRSAPKQIERWAAIGRVAEQNPDLSYDFIVGLLQAKAELEAGSASGFSFE
jgi:hypothetical protein